MEFTLNNILVKTLKKNIRRVKEHLKPPFKNKKENAYLHLIVLEPKKEPFIQKGEQIWDENGF